jgi:hypothetical protein
MTKKMQAKDIPDEKFLEAIDTVLALRDQTIYPIRGLGASLYDIAAVLTGHADDVVKFDGTRARYSYDELSNKVLLIKAKSLLRRKLIRGCGCGCRGDFQRIR